jgi:hypothetical protein
MLRIRSEQMQVFQAAALQNFEDEMVAHSKKYSLRLCQVLGDEQIHVAVHGAIERCFEYGFTFRGPIRLFIEMMFMLGSHFDRDPQYPWAGDILRDSETADQMKRADRLFKKIKDYLEKVCGPDNVNVRKALETLSAYAQGQTPISSQEIESALISRMASVFPEKVAYIGEGPLMMLIKKGRKEAQEYNFTSARAQTLIPTLMFAFGHDCTDDPLYPWIGRTLRDEKITEPAARADRLERKAITWLNSVLSGSTKGGRP